MAARPHRARAAARPARAGPRACASASSCNPSSITPRPRARLGRALGAGAGVKLARPLRARARHRRRRAGPGRGRPLARPRDGPARPQPLRRDARAHAGDARRASTRWSSTCRTWARATTRSSTRCSTSWRPARARASAWWCSTARTRSGATSSTATCSSPSTAPSSGMHPLAVRHGMTAGELALMFREELALDVDLHVVPMKGWRRRDALRGHGPALGAALAEHPDRGHGVRLPRAAAWSRGRTSRRAAAPRGRSSSWARRGSTAHALARALEERAHPGRRLPRRRLHARRSRSTRARCATACRCTSPTAGASPRSSPTCC